MADRDAWERELRRCLSEQAAGGRAPSQELAGTVLARGRRMRRRRSVAGLVAVVGATLLASGALLQGWQSPGPSEFGAVTGVVDDSEPVTPSPAEPVRLAANRTMAVQLSVDLLGDGAGGGVVLATGEGRLMDLGPIRQVISAHRLGDGWAVVAGSHGTARLWWVTADQRPISLLAGMDTIVVEGGRVAWRRGALLAAGALSSSGNLQDQASTTAPAGDAQPVGFVGGAVVLARTDPGGWDTWEPDLGRYRPAWTQEVVRVYAGQPDALAPVGLVPAESGSGGPCLARLDLGPLGPGQEVSCVAKGLSADGPASVSPHGRWLVTTIDRPDAGQDARARQATVLVDLTAAFATDPAAVTEVEQAPDLAARPVWPEPDQALLTTTGTVVRVWPERLVAGARDAVEVVSLSGTAPLLVQPV